MISDELKMEIDVRGIDAVSFCLGTYCMFVYLLCLSVVVTSTMCLLNVLYYHGHWG